ncbi:MAG: hypothetical protein DWQ05_02910 [Calditrichaeota bacterium]|nr:MAG: hypothetical protein DWQ05_02910 [Calditrichota bacterium]
MKPTDTNTTPPIYYYANQVYQLSYALPLYKKASGVFVARDVKRFYHLKKHFKNFNHSSDKKTFLNTPPIHFMGRKKLRDIEGVIIFMSNAPAIVEQNLAAKTIFVGHGTGDKPYLVAKSKLENFDYHFVSGPKYEAILKDSGINIPADKLIKTGNLRFDDYLNGHLKQDHELDRLGVVDKERKTVLYAPTWKWGDGTLLKYGHRFAREITQKFNLIIRPHHQDTKHIRKIKNWAKANKINHLYFSNPSNLVTSDTMQDFAASDIMISDTSSVLYEYLVTKQPIIVIKNNYKKLHNMPVEMDIMQHVPIFSEGDNIVKMLDGALEDAAYHTKLENLLSACFFFNDGKSVERALNFIKSIR